MNETGEPDPVGVAADHMSQSVRESIEAARSSFQAARDGTYDSKRLVRDIGDAWSRAVRDGARMVTNTVRVAEHLATKARPVPDAGTEQPPATGEGGERRGS
jgi:hypothetical protein